MKWLLLLLPLALSAQVVIDNDQVRVLSVTSPPRVKGKLHDHKINRVMVYLDPGTQTLAYADGHEEKTAWRAGEVKWSPASGMHTSENTSGRPYRIVEIELKGKPGPPAAAMLDPVKVDPRHYKVEFENDQVRVVRAIYGPHEKGALHEHASNRVVTYLTGQNMRVTRADGVVEPATGKPGDVRFAGRAKHTEENLSDQPFEVVVVELK